jgi:hypothetical protein
MVGLTVLSVLTMGGLHTKPLPYDFLNLYGADQWSGLLVDTGRKVRAALKVLLFECEKFKSAGNFFYHNPVDHPGPSESMTLACGRSTGHFCARWAFVLTLISKPARYETSGNSYVIQS